MDLRTRIEFNRVSPARDISSWNNGKGYTGDYNNLPLGFFILEALRFYNFQSKNAIEKIKWTFMTPELFSDGLADLRENYNSGLRYLMQDLYRKRNLHNFYNLDRIKYKIRKNGKLNPSFSQFSDPAQKARFTARIFLSDEYRTEAFVDKSPGRGEFRGIKLEQLGDKLVTIKNELEHFLTLKLFEVPTKYYGSWSINSNDQILSHDYYDKAPVSLKPDRISNMYGGLAYLTEHLYLHLNAPPLGARIKRTNKKDIISGRDPRLSVVTELMDEVEDTISVLGHYSKEWLTTWNRWQQGISILEAYFTHAILTANASGNDDIKKVGLDWAPLLLMILRWFLLDLRVRTLMSALPISTFYVGDWSYQGVQPNSYLGLCLWEALSGRKLRHPSLPYGLLDTELPVSDTYEISANEDDKEQEKNDKKSDNNIGIIQSDIKIINGPIHKWPYIISGHHWGPDLSPFEDALPGIMSLREFAEKPIFKKVLRDKEGKRTVDADDIKHYETSIGPYSPIIQRVTKSGSPDRPDFYSISSFIRNPVVTELNFAASFQTQAHLFVMDAILRRASKLTGLDTKYRNKQKQREKNIKQERILLKKRKQLIEALRETKQDGKDYCRDLGFKLEYDRQYKGFVSNNNYHLTAGSYLFGGKYPPHKTHRDGIHYDISMGPDVMPWQTSKSTAFLSLVYPWLVEKGLLNFSKEEMLAGIFKNGKYKGVYDIYDVNHFPKDTCKKKLRVTHNFMLNYKNNIFNHLNGVTTEQSFVNAEEILSGTPHFQNKDDGELAHVGHLCILLSAPYRIVYASPIVHLRALKAINQSASELDEKNKKAGKPGKYHELVKKLTTHCDFAFLPHNHHHHWHLYYWTKTNNKYDDISTFSKYMDLWLMLGIDLRDLTKYFNRYNDIYLQPGTFGYENAKSERDSLLRFLSKYNEEYIYRYESTGSTAEVLASEEFIKNIFSPVVVNLDGSLLMPAAGPPKKISKLKNGKDSIYTFGTKLKTHLKKMLELYDNNKDDSNASEEVEKLKNEINRSFSYRELREREVEIDPDYWEESLMYEVWGLEDYIE